MINEIIGHKDIVYAGVNEIIEHEDIVNAVAQGWCAPETRYTVMDATLAYAIVASIERMLWEHYGINTHKNSTDVQGVN
jgi:hypothetical protein